MRPRQPRAAAGLRRGTRLALAPLAAALLVLAALPPGATWQGKAREQAPDAVAPPSPAKPLSVLDEAVAEIGALQEQVEAGQVLPDFGQQAQELVESAASRAGTAAAEVELALDGALQALFLRQAALLRAQVAAGFKEGGCQLDALARADRDFVARAQALVRPGSGWDFGPERAALRTMLGGSLRRSAALVEERARAAQAQRATIDVIGRLQGQMEQLQQKVQGARGGGSPWVFSTSYRLPNTPLQLAGRYEQGRANVELSLTPDKNPTDSEASFVDGIGPANLGVSFNLGI
mmetsp:Transcript_33268/g.105324  ORF Transcript_33268/g.105324 Transcript_33268/m.105324 type:complete len:292 (+) Transcript_33268:86-961(+)